MHKGRIVPLGEDVINSIFQKFGVDKEEGDHTMEADGRVMLIDVDKLKPHPRNEEIYGKESVEDLSAQIEAYGGIADPIKIKEDNTIISGHRRWQAARELGMTKVPCQIVSYDSEEEELAALVMLNYHRTKTNEQKAREGMVLEQALRAEGMERKLKALRQSHLDRDPGSPTAASEEADDSSEDTATGDKKGRTRDIVANAVKISSGRNFDRMKKVIIEADKLKADGKSDDAAFLLQMLDKSVKPASNLLDAGYLSLSDEEREPIRNGEIPVNQFVAEQLSKSKPKLAFKKIIENFRSVEQVLSNAVQAVDSLNDDDADELMKSLEKIKAALTTVTAKVEEQRKNLLD